MSVQTISSKGWVVIPADLRRKYRLTGGVHVRVVDYGGVLALVPLLDAPIEQTAGLLKGQSSLTNALLADRTEERERE